MIVIGIVLYWLIGCLFYRLWEKPHVCKEHNIYIEADYGAYYTICGRCEHKTMREIFWPITLLLKYLLFPVVVCVLYLVSNASLWLAGIKDKD